MVRTNRFFPLLSAGFIVLAGCQDELPTTIEPGPSPEQSAELPGRNDLVEVRPHEELFHRISAEVKGYGGHFFDEKGNLVAYLVDLGEAERARAILEGVLRERQPSRRETTGGTIQFVQAKYSFLELADWRNRAGEAVLDAPGVLFVDLDEAQNRFVVGMTSTRYQEEAAKVLSEHAVPAEAVSFEINGRVEELKDLRDYSRGIEGGYQIASVNGTCTLGFNAYWRGYAGFMTNSHCTSAFWKNDGTLIYQNNTSAAANLVGWEAYDPGANSCGFLGLYRCRWSDAAVIRKYSDVPWRFRKIARTMSWGFGAGNSGSRTVNPNAPSMTITSEYSFPTGGEMFDKMGRTTGWTYGFVNKTCVDHNKGGNRRLLCQDWIRHMHADFGDSGSPIFRWYGSTVSLAGLLWGKTTQNGVPYIIMSAMWNIERDVGALTTF